MSKYVNGYLYSLLGLMALFFTSCQQPTLPEIKKNFTSSLQFVGMQEGLAQQAENHKALLIFITSDEWCYWCNVMEQNTLEDKELGAFITKNFIPVRYNTAEKPTFKVQEHTVDGAEFAETFGIKSFPSILVLQEDMSFVLLTGNYELGKLKEELNKMVVQ